jgi:hypothetical protein
VASNTQIPDKSNLIAPLAIIAALVPIIGGVVWYFERTPPARQQPAKLTDAAREYTQHLKLSNVNMKATANYVGATIIEITGQITNTGNRPLSLVELNCVFHDPNGMVVLRERVPIVRRQLEPGQTRDFRLPFEGIPESWNQAMPTLVIANINFAG